MKSRERMKHVKSLHVHNGSVDAKLCPVKQFEAVSKDVSLYYSKPVSSQVNECIHGHRSFFKAFAKEQIRNSKRRRLIELVNKRANDLILALASKKLRKNLGKIKRNRISAEILGESRC